MSNGKCILTRGTRMVQRRDTFDADQQHTAHPDSLENDCTASNGEEEECSNTMRNTAAI